tara:strand:+ start:534 stop:1337 length:804 start_codon:yes stop_codon:yes gene_type:complete
MVAALTLLTSCNVLEEAQSPLEAMTAAVRLGPHEKCDGRPKFFLVDEVAEASLAEMVPFERLEMVLNGRRSAEKCSHFAIARLIVNRPDAILVYPSSSEVTGVTTNFIYTPWTGMFTTASAQSQTGLVAYAMRAARCRLPFQMDRPSGFVRAIHDRDAVPGLLDGDTITLIQGRDSRVPKEWPTWGFYGSWLDLSPGDSIEVEWIRSGKGKMSGVAKMIDPLSPHLQAGDSISTKWMPQVRDWQDEDGNAKWHVNSTRWEPPDNQRF